MEFTKMRRLERARQMLQTPDAATTVTGTALLCGFHNQGHFARAYRNQFGELPSETLNNNR
jgi:transcriptional regulator GlxA family with amidase domain